MASMQLEVGQLPACLGQLDWMEKEGFLFNPKTKKKKKKKKKKGSFLFLLCSEVLLSGKVYGCVKRIRRVIGLSMK